MLIDPPTSVDTNSYVLQQSFDGAFQFVIFLLGGILSCVVGVLGLAFSGRAEA